MKGIYIMARNNNVTVAKELGINDFANFKIDVIPTTVGEMIMDNTIRCMFVPPYQRLYEWTKVHCATLLEDLYRSIQNCTQHFFGDVSMFNKTREKYSITDGQQRTTSLVLLGLAILDIIGKEKKKYKREIDAFKSLVYNSQNNLRISLNKNDLLIMNTLVFERDKLDTLSKSLRDGSHIEKNFNFFKDEMVKYINSGGNLMSLFHAIHNLKVVLIDCPMENAQIIYASKNSKGLPMSQTDQIKNLLLSTYQTEEKQMEMLDNYWLTIEENVYRSNMTDFIMDAMIIFAATENISGFDWAVPRNLYQNMMNFLKEMPEDNNEEKVTKIFEAMAKYAKLYKKYINVDPAIYSMADHTPLENTLYIYEHIFGGRMYNSIVLYLLDKYESGVIQEKTMVDVINAFVISQCRAKIVGQFKGAQRKNAPPKVKLLKQKFDSKKIRDLEDFVWKEFLVGNGVNHVPSDIATFSYLANNPYSLSRFDKNLKKDNHAIRYILYMMNLVASNGKGIPAFDVKKCNVEHVICQDNEPAWNESLSTTNKDIAERYVHQFGNLVLVDKTSDFKMLEDRKPAYANSSYALTREIATIKKYNGKVVYEQTKRFAELFLKAFPIPTKYNPKKNRVNKTFVRNTKMH